MASVRIPVVVDGNFVDRRFVEAFVLCGGDYLCAESLSSVVGGESVVKMVEHSDIGMVAAEVDLGRLRRSGWYEFAQLARSVGLASLMADDPETATRVLASSLLALKTILAGDGSAAAEHLSSIIDDLMNTRMIISGFTSVDINGVNGTLSMVTSSVEHLGEHVVIVDVTLTNMGRNVMLHAGRELGVEDLGKVRDADGFIVTAALGPSTRVVVSVYSKGGRYAVGYKVAYTSEDGVEPEALKRVAALAARLAAALIRGDEVEARRVYEELRGLSVASVQLLEEGALSW